MSEVFEMDPGLFEQSREHEGDNKLFVVFYRGSKINEAKSTEAGRPVHDDVDLVKIVFPGQRDTVVAEADYGYQQRFPKQWAQFKANAEQIGSGTPLAEVPWLTPAQIANLKSLNVHTVEQLAGMPDSNAHVMMGFHGLKQRAEAYLDAAKGAAPMIQMQAALDKRDAELAELKATLAKLLAAQPAAKTTK